MKNKGIFKRVEKKYLMNTFQYRALRAGLTDIAEVDAYGETSILNIYYDTPDFHLIRRSLDRPLYKEKLRLRSYGIPDNETTVYAEIKKKFNGVVYKRRVPMSYADARTYLDVGADPGCVDPASEAGQRFAAVKEAQSWTPIERQISGEIDYFLQRYSCLQPQMAVSYDRIAMAGTEDPELRITFDRNIRWRTEDLDLRLGGGGHTLLRDDQILMEIKIMGSMPRRLAEIMSRLRIFSTSFSKYGGGYQQYEGQQMRWLVSGAGMNLAMCQEAGRPDCSPGSYAARNK